MSLLTLVITTPERIVFQNDVDGVSLPTTDGQITILANHLPLVTVLKPGELIIRQGSEQHPYAIGGGFIETDGRKLTILAETAEHLEEIDEQKAQEALDRAAKLKEEKRHDTEEFAAIAAKLDRDLTRLMVIKKYRHRGHTGITQEGIRKE